MKHDLVARPFALILPSNTEGHDYVVGDLHGCFDELMDLMSQVNFNKATDRIICTGDLVHRGNKSRECLSLLKEKWFYSTVGNHDTRLMITRSQDYEDRKPYFAELDNLPYIIYVEESLESRGFFVVHGEIPYDLVFAGVQPPKPYTNGLDLMVSGEYPKSLNKALRESVHNKQWRFTDYDKMSDPMFKSLIWGRELLKRACEAYKNNPAKDVIEHLDSDSLKNCLERGFNIFCGHNTVVDVKRIGHQIYLDTGAAYAYTNEKEKDRFFLSMVQTHTGKIFRSQQTKKQNPQK